MVELNTKTSVKAMCKDFVSLVSAYTHREILCVFVSLCSIK